MATVDDAQAVREIYAPYVIETPISFELEPPDVVEMGRRIGKALEVYPWLIAEKDGRVFGYAYASKHRERAAYQWSVDVSVYVEREGHRRGVGRALYTALLAIVRAQGFVNAYGGITQPNEASVGLHETMGFRHLGTYTDVGFKLGAWHSVGWWALQLGEPKCAPEAPVSLPGLRGSAIEQALERATNLLNGRVGTPR